MDNIEHYKNLLIEYSQGIVNKKLEKEGKLVKNTSPVYAIYVRKSTKGKKSQERSIDDQLKACKRLADDNGLKVVRIFKEKESARKEGIRDVFSEMITGIKNKHFNSIIAWHPDRLARNMKDAGLIIDMLDKHLILDIQFPSYTFVNDPNGLMALGIQFVLAKQYSDSLSVTTKRGSHGKAQEGKGNAPTYGYILDENCHFRPENHSFTLMHKAFEMALDKQPLDVIAEHLNLNKFSFKKKICKMTKQKLSGIFSNPLYAGIFVYADKIVDMKIADPEFVPVIAPLEFLELRNILDGYLGFKRKISAEILLRQMVKCHYCGNYMTPGKPRSGGKSKLRYLRLSCTRKECKRYKEKNSDGKNIAKDIRAKVIFEYIIEFLSTKLRLDKRAYSQYIEEAKKYVKTDRDENIQMLKILDRKLKEVQNTINKKAETLLILKDSKLLDEINDEISRQMEERESLTLKREETKRRITDIDHNTNSELISYENFLNFFNNIVGIVQNHDNRLLVDKVIRMVFLNFEVNDKKVVSHQLNPSFEKFIDMPSVLNGGTDGTRTRNLFRDREAL